MYFSTILPYCLLGLAAASTPTFDSTFESSYAFSATILLGPPPNNPRTNPITIPGGIIINEPFLGGTISGPLINGSIIHGQAAPRIYLNGTLQEPVVDLYGLTATGIPFSIHAEGIGSPAAQVARIVVSIGGGDEYDSLRNGFLLTSIQANANRTIAQVNAFLVANNVHT